MNNRVNLAQLDGLSIAEGVALGVAQFEMLLEELTEHQARVKRYDDKLHAIMDRAFVERASEARRADGKDTGTVRLTEDEYVIVADLPKKVTWDQAKLTEAAATVKGWGENPADYVDIKLSVPERKFSAWPATIRKVFEAARSVAPGRATYKIERAKREAA